MFFRTAWQVGEAVWIRRRGEDNLLNSKTEYSRCQITSLSLPHLDTPEPAKSDVPEGVVQSTQDLGEGNPDHLIATTEHRAENRCHAGWGRTGHHNTRWPRGAIPSVRWKPGRGAYPSSARPIRGKRGRYKVQERKA